MAENGERLSRRALRQRRRECVGEYVTIYARGRVWWGEFMADHEQQRVSLGTRSKKEARRRARIIDAELITGKYRPSKRAPLIRDVVKTYMEFLKTEGRRDGTLKRYRPELERFADFCAKRRVTLLNAVSLALMDKYRAWRTEAGAEPSTLYHECTVIKQLLNFAFEREMIATNPLKKLKLRKPKPGDPVAFTLDEVEAILTKSHERYRPIFEFLAFTGVRIGELEWLTWEDVDFEKGFVEIRAKDDWKPKDGDDRSVPMNQRVRRLLDGLPRDGRWVFLGPPCAKYPEGGQRVAERRALGALKKAARKAGVPEEKRTLHTFRHFFASFCANNGVPPFMLAKWLGHSSLEMVMRYYTLGKEESVRAMEALSCGGMAEKSES
jgi:integrase